MPRYRFTLRSLLLSMAVVAVFLAIAVVISHRIDDARAESRRMQMGGHIKFMVVAMHNYHDSHQILPAAITYNSNNVAVYGWRTSLLDYIEGGPLFAAYNTNAAWNDPTNVNLCSFDQPMFGRPGSTNACAFATNIVVVVGPGTLFPGGNPLSFGDIQDDPATTIMIVEIDYSDIPWYEPRDLHIDQMSFQINDPDRTIPCIGNRRSRGAWVGMADGQIRFLPQDTPPETLKAMLTIAGGEKVTLP